MKIKWEQNTRSWFGTLKTVFPRFEAWRSVESSDNDWCLNMVKSPNTRPIRVRHLQSLDAAKEFAQGLLAEFDWIPDRNPVGIIGCESVEQHLGQPAEKQPVPQVT